MTAAGMTEVGLIGRGTIGSVLARALVGGEVPGCRLAGVLRRGAGSIDDLVARSEVVVEAAGAEALAAYGPIVVAAGVDLLVLSVGALADDDLRARLLNPDPPPRPAPRSEPRGRVLLSAGAVGGLDLLRAAALLGPVHHARLTTTKQPAALVRPWMSAAKRTWLVEASEPVTVFAGAARDAVARFPESANVSATLALATVGFDATAVELIADPRAELVRHRIEVDAEAGQYTFEIRNRPSANPRTSAITPYAVIRALQDLSASVVVGA
jgi:aspartate dehydrogenase